MYCFFLYVCAHFVSAVPLLHMKMIVKLPGAKFVNPVLYIQQNGFILIIDEGHNMHPVLIFRNNCQCNNTIRHQRALHFKMCTLNVFLGNKRETRAIVFLRISIPPSPLRDGWGERCLVGSGGDMLPGNRGEREGKGDMVPNSTPVSAYNIRPLPNILHYALFSRATNICEPHNFMHTPNFFAQSQNLTLFIQEVQQGSKQKNLSSLKT